ncbi:phosphotransferase family protein [Pseudofrankia sp. BMG5.37]|uniref:phosphotransferase family protein n=1 Tax=Pseudofrankia sp. BMG5.37 TaxID=3050035 RepID=UPI0028946E70|nr:phosphotransferase family protein [Pseudofrankia sp. BMG5.37]MDT3441912.1 phosphotransferase family protein [Pseudofrankia sp. BMG5.37]
MGTGTGTGAAAAGGALVDLPALEGWLETVLPGGGPARRARLGEATGIANALFTVDWGGRTLVLRRAPAARITSSAGNTVREAWLLAALADTPVRHPRLVAACPDPAVIGAPFILMERVDGFTPAGGLPAPFDADPASRRAFGLEAVDALAELALVNWRAVGLEGFGKPDGFLDRQVDRWLWQLGTYQARPLPDATDNLAAWLRAHQPATGPIAIMHGDYSLFNVMFAPGAPARLAAIVDWDTATIGDPLMDLGHLLARWDEPGEPATFLGSSDVADRTGLAGRAELAARYAERTGHSVADLRFYEVLALFKLGCIMEGHHAQAARTGDPSGARFAPMAPAIFADALAIARGDRTP